MNAKPNEPLLSRVQDTSAISRAWKPPLPSNEQRSLAAKAGLSVYDSGVAAQAQGIETGGGGMGYIDPRESFRIIPPLRRA